MKSKKSKPPMVAVDLGGTNLRIGLVTAKGQVVARSRSKMRRVTEGDGLRDLLSDRISAFIERKGIGRRAGAVTIGFAGPTDSRSGRIYFAPNVGGLSDIRLAEGLKTRLGMEVFVANDADCAALGEFWQGAGRGASSLFLFTLGTGMGGAMVIGGDLWEGSTGIAGDISLPRPCTTESCRVRGSWCCWFAVPFGRLCPKSRTRPAPDPTAPSRLRRRL